VLLYLKVQFVTFFTLEIDREELAKEVSIYKEYNNVK
jgi:hypothetical protein